MPASGYDRAQRRLLEDAVRRGERPRCPVCGGALEVEEVPRPREVAYVRQRLLLLCRACGRAAAVDAQ